MRTTVVLKLLPVGDFNNISVASAQIKEIEIRLHTVLKYFGLELSQGLPGSTDIGHLTWGDLLKEQTQTTCCTVYITYVETLKVSLTHF